MGVSLCVLLRWVEFVEVPEKHVGVSLCVLLSWVELFVEREAQGCGCGPGKQLSWGGNRPQVFCGPSSQFFHALFLSAYSLVP